MAWQAVTLGAALERNVARDTNARGFVFKDSAMTWGEIDRYSDRLARGFLAHGVRHGEHVAIYMANSIDWIAALFALGKIGAVAVPVNTRYKAEEMSYVLRQSDARLLIAMASLGDRDYSAVLAGALTELPELPVIFWGEPPVVRPARSVTWAEFEGLSTRCTDAKLAAAKAAVTPGDFLLIQYTSGTTGFPKGALLRHDQMLRNAAGYTQRMGMTNLDRLFSTLPFFHVGGSVASILLSLWSGATYFGTDRFSPEDALTTMERERCTALAGLETHLVDIISHPQFAQADLSSVRTGWTARNVRVFDTFGGMLNIYGMSETSAVVTIGNWDDPLELRRDTVGFSLEGLELRIVHPDTHVDLPEGQTGLILVRGWGVTAGYYNQPEASAKAMLPGGWFDTGDLGALQPDGYLRFSGRAKDTVRVGGENVSCLEVEMVINSHPKVQVAAVVPVPHPRLQEVPCAAVLVKGDNQPTAEEIIDLCKERLASFKVPRHVLFLTELPLTGSGKVAKPPLRQLVLKMLGMAE